MDSKAIRELIEFVSRSNFSTFEMEQDGFRIKLVKGESAPAGAVSTAVAAPAVPVAAPAPEGEPEAAAESPTGDGLHELLSPIVGTFYSAPGPEAPNFVEIGAQVKKGQVLCIVEAMKVMNEIESEIDAEVAEILVESGQPVEFGEVLFRLRPLS